MLKRTAGSLHNTLFTLIIIGALFLATGFASLHSVGALPPVITPSTASDRASSPEIIINRDADLAAFPGDGTPNNPYLLVNLAITGSGECVEISDTRQYVIIANCLFTEPTPARATEVGLTNATNIAILNNTFWGSGPNITGAFVDNCTNVTVGGNWFTNFTSTGDEVAIDIYANDTNIYVTGNQVPHVWIGINVGRGLDAATTNVWVTGNYVSNCQSGIQFDDLLNGAAYVAYNTLINDTNNISLTNSTNVDLVDNLIINTNVSPPVDWYQTGFYILIGVAAVLAVVIVIQVARGRKS